MIPWILLLSAQAQTVLTVPAPYPTVLEAVDAAQSGDIVEIDASAAWNRATGQDVPIAKDLTIRGVNGRPILPRVVVSNGAVVELEEVEIRGVNRNHNLVGIDVGLLALEGSVIVRDSQLRTNLSAAAGIVASGTQLTLERVDAQGFWGNPVIQTENGTLDVVDSSFDTNDQGVLVTTNTVLTVSGSSFTDNWGTLGADLTVSNISPLPVTVSNCDFAFSVAESGGSIFAVNTDLSIDSSTFETPTAWDSGGAIALIGEDSPSTLTLTNSDVFTGFANGGGALALVNVVGSVIDGSSFTDNFAAAAGALVVAGGDLTIRDSLFDSNLATWNAGQILVGDPDGDPAYEPLAPTQLTLEDVEVMGVVDQTEALSAGCLQGVLGAEITISGGRFKHCASDLDGGAITHAGTLLEVDGTEFRDNHAIWGGAIQQTAGTLTVQNAVFEENGATNGAAIRTSDVENTLLGNWFANNAADTAGAVELLSTQGLELRHNRFCSNSIASDGAVVNITGGEGGPYAVKNNVWLENHADLGTALRYLPADWLGNVGPLMEIHNNDLVDNDLSTALLVKGQVDVRNNILAGHPIGLILDPAPWNNELSGDYNLWFELGAEAQGTEGAFPMPGAVIDEDPAFQGRTVGDCLSNLWLTADSPARDAGDPEVLDPDGSRSDIGAFGGPGADLADNDGDGFFEDLDCDDADKTVYPGQVDIPYDGIDNDCDGADLCDGDGDGFDAVSCGGTDCNDTDPEVKPGATDVADDGLDNDCDGFERKSFLAGGGCACDGSGGPASGLAVGLLLLLSAGRRRG